MSLKIGFIGLGNLGSVIAENILEKGYTLHVYNRTADKVKPFVDKGAVQDTSVKALAASCDIVISIVSDDAAVTSITTGVDGIAANLKKDGIHISMSTISPVAANEMAVLHAQHNNHYIASPVMGRPEAAKARKLNFCVAGNEKVKQEIDALLEDAGSVKRWDYGEEPGAANVAKLCTNFMLVAAIEAMAEGLALAEQSSVPKKKVMDMLSQTLFNCPVYTNYGNSLVEEKYLPAGFSLQLGLKDIKLVAEQAAATNTQMPIGDLLKNHLQDAVKNKLGDHDLTAVALMLHK